ncbi:hypothetical protein PFICI_12379 [Pestalotiopsis fici W106-1]|uniref:Uncharacterized protein n=1 Tax=Pestalotiopsis fici (strain W106-1 / CGMCC3.15140) TaxID=1229662 RepID=W3WNE5_PESFW|nr:uncharacterized protein PFICI_12379 [Pestalotiopsis fici W106-1]ETS75435.1 hypothetical protein PFICI_12379 [Pestalotiopsis fici W106-1]
MASPAVALPNGVPDEEPAHSQPRDDVEMADAQSTTSIKRKREPSINGIAHDVQLQSTANGDSQSHEFQQALIRDYLVVLEPFDATPSLLKRPLPDPEDSDEPSAKRNKSEDGSTQPSVTDKAAKGEYADLSAVMLDIKASVKDQLDQLRNLDADKVTKDTDIALAKTIAFDRKARELFRREISYPSTTQNPSILREFDPSSDLQSNATGNVVMRIFGEAPRPRHLYTSLQQPVKTPDNPLGAVQPLRESNLPIGVKTAKAVPFSFPSAVEKDKRSKTLGELFPAPRSLPTLQPPKAPKSTTKGVQVGWHRPELTEKSKYRTGSYSGQSISTGRWLDYSNAAPPSQILTKQRERAMSLAGIGKQPPSHPESSEMDALFRGAFSSFAPSKDDSAAMVSSGLISQTMWWQKYGKRSFDRLIENESGEETGEDETNGSPHVELDEKLLQEAIENWDTNIDPSLEEMCNPKKSKEEQDVDDILQDVSDMIQTLVSFQKIRNLTLPSAANQSRYATDPTSNDMLNNGTPAQPSEDETATYDALKAQLALIVATLPPYAVARLNSDKLEELSISTRLEVRTDEYQGTMEEDEAAARARAAQQPSPAPRPAVHRSSSSTNNATYGGSYGSTPRPAVPSPAYYGTQTPIRPPANVARPPPNMPPYTQQRPPSNAGYRPTNGYGANTNYAQNMGRTPQSFPPPPNSFAATPPPNRTQYQPSPQYQNMGGHPPPPRYANQPPPGQVPAYQQPGYPQQQQPGTPQPQFNQYTPNGAPGMPPRPAVSPQVAHQQPQFAPHQNFNPNTTPSRASYGGPPPVTMNARQHYYPPTGAPQAPAPQPPPPPGQGQQNAQQTLAFQTSLHPHQVEQAMNQAKARFNATPKAPETARPPSAQGQPVAAPVGLGGIGLGGARPPVPGAVNYNTPSPSPKPQVNSPALSQIPAANGTPVSANETPVDAQKQA